MYSHTYRIAAGAVLFIALTLSTAWAAPGEKDYKIDNGIVKNDGKAFTIRAIHVLGLAASEGDFAEMVTALARIAEVGGNTVCFDLAGFNADGTELSGAGIRTVKIYEERVKAQWMGLVVRVLGDSTDPAFRRNAVVTAAKALKNQSRTAFWIDGPNAASLARAFKQAAPDRLVIAEAGGDIAIHVGGKPGTPLSDAVKTEHFVLAGAPETYAKLDAALANPAESAPWTPDNSILTAEERADGFIALFNGKNLDGWWRMGDNKDAYRVKDGAIEWAQGGGKALCTVDRYGDFVLRVEWKIVKDGNNGLWLRAPRDGRASKIGVESQMMGDSANKRPDKSNTGAIYDVIAPLKQAAKPEGEWNDLEIVFEGPRYKATLNGELIQDVNFDNYQELKYRLRSGFICITDHGHYAAFRNIRLKQL